jgi:biotin-dependent carboxylase-like uncharacterized protein
MIRVLKAGALTTLQDLGRRGMQRYGVPVNGAMDESSHRIANILVGNDEGEATLECTLTGPTLRFEHDHLVALCGADLGALIDDERAPRGQPLLVRAGATLSFAGRRTGARVYLAARGGFDVEPVLGSRSTFLAGHFGGYHGRALARGDRLALRGKGHGYPEALRLMVQSGTPFASAAQPELPPPDGSLPTVRYIRGPQWEHFADAARAAFESEEFVITPESDRMGYWLSGPALPLAQPFEMVSEATSFGTVQVPPSGKAVVLMADRQGAGGYPKIGYVASVDLPLLAQAVPGDRLRFNEIDMAEAQRLYLARENGLAGLRATVARAMQPRHAPAPVAGESGIDDSEEDES